MAILYALFVAVWSREASRSRAPPPPFTHSFIPLDWCLCCVRGAVQGPLDDCAGVWGAVVHAVRVVDTLMTTNAVITLGASTGNGGAKKGV